MRGRDEFQYNPLDFEKDIAIGLTLPMTNDAQAAAKYDVVDKAAGIDASSLTDSQGLHESAKKVTADFTLSYTTLEQTKSNMRNLVLTNKGERIMHPNFGCDIYRLLFEPISPSVVSRIKRNVKEQVDIWLEYVNLLEVDVKQPQPDINRVDINIWFALYNDTINKEMITLNNIGAM